DGAPTHKILRICARQGVPILADMTYIGAGDWVTTAKRPTEAVREIFRRSRIRLNPMTAITKAVFTLERQR
ncbi:IS5/IS1182 family transposase, partial [Streptomyces sp. NPDC048489]